MSYLFYIGFLEVNLVDFLDVTFVALLIYTLYKLIRGSAAYKVFLGFMSLYITYVVVKATRMELFSEVLGQFMNVGVLAGVVLFQQEIKRFLVMVGTTADIRENTFGKFLFTRKKNHETLNISQLIEAMKSMSSTKTGALIVLSKGDNLRSFAQTGDILNAQLSTRLLLSIFFKNSPLHDGAVIIYENTVVAARCILPVSENENISATLGLRHRAAIGMTEVTDSIVLTVSEETGKMSVVHKGKIHHDMTASEIISLIGSNLISHETTSPPIDQNTSENQ